MPLKLGKHQCLRSTGARQGVLEADRSFGTKATFSENRLRAALLAVPATPAPQNGVIFDSECFSLLSRF